MIYKERLDKEREKGCLICGEKETCCLDFHHIDPSKKVFNVSLRNRVSNEKLEEELSKCIILCANCHRKVHAGILDISKYGNFVS